MSRRCRRLLRRLALAGAAATLLAATVASPAAAHVGVSSADAAPGGYGLVVLRVPNESDTASTVAVSVTLPKDTPFASVSVQPLAGWTVSAPEVPLGRTVTVGDFTLTRAVTTVTWTARAGSGIGPGEFQQFSLALGPFAAGAPSLALPTVQTYSDGTVVRWDQPTTPGAEEPENPAPVLALTGTPVDDDGKPLVTPAASTPPTSGPTLAGPSRQSVDGSDSTARALAIAGLVIALIAAGLAALGLRARRT